MTQYWNGTQWDTLRPFNRGMVQDLELLYKWDLQHPGEFAYHPDLCVAAGLREGREVAKLAIWKMIEWAGVHYSKDGNRAAYYRITDHGKDVYQGNVSFPYDYWESDKALNYAYRVFLWQVKEGFDLRTLRQVHLRSFGQGPPPSPPSGGVSPVPPTPRPPLSPTLQARFDRLRGH